MSFVAEKLSGLEMESESKKKIIEIEKNTVEINVVEFSRKQSKTKYSNIDISLNDTRIIQ